MDKQWVLFSSYLLFGVFLPITVEAAPFHPIGNVTDVAALHEGRRRQDRAAEPNVDFASCEHAALEWYDDACGNTVLFCNPGEMLASSCASNPGPNEADETRCDVCPPGTFQETYNTCPACHPCSVCSDLEEVQDACEVDTDTVCTLKRTPAMPVASVALPTATEPQSTHPPQSTQPPSTTTPPPPPEDEPSSIKPQVLSTSPLPPSTSQEETPKHAQNESKICSSCVLADPDTKIHILYAVAVVVLAIFLVIMCVCYCREKLKNNTRPQGPQEMPLTPVPSVQSDSSGAQSSESAEEPGESDPFLPNGRQARESSGSSGYVRFPLSSMGQKSRDSREPLYAAVQKNGSRSGGDNAVAGSSSGSDIAVTSVKRDNPDSPEDAPPLVNGDSVRNLVGDMSKASPQENKTRDLTAETPLTNPEHKQPTASSVSQEVESPPSAKASPSQRLKNLDGDLSKAIPQGDPTTIPRTKTQQVHPSAANPMTHLQHEQTTATLTTNSQQMNSPPSAKTSPCAPSKNLDGDVSKASTQESPKTSPRIIPKQAPPTKTHRTNHDQTDGEDAVVEAKKGSMSVDNQDNPLTSDDNTRGTDNRKDPSPPTHNAVPVDGSTPKGATFPTRNAASTQGSNRKDVLLPTHNATSSQGSAPGGLSVPTDNAASNQGVPSKGNDPSKTSDNQASSPASDEARDGGYGTDVANGGTSVNPDQNPTVATTGAGGNQINGGDVVTTQFLQHVAQVFSLTQLKIVCRMLGLLERDIEDIEALKVPEERGFECLKKLLGQRGKDLTYARLIAALIKSKNKNYADQLINEFNIRLAC